MPLRSLTPSEKQLIEALLSRSSVRIAPENWGEVVRAEEMSDGGMGSLRLFPPAASKLRVFGAVVSELEFIDVDGVKVVASLVVDQCGELFELDIWKTDFSRLVSLP